MTRAIGWTCFDTAIGPCALAWNERAIVGAQLPEETAAASRARMQKRFGAALERDPDLPHARHALDVIVALLRGEDRDLTEIVIETDDVTEFDRRVYAIARTIRRGTTMTYGDIARQLGDRTLARAVGQSLGRNPFAPIVPCHRVLAANGGMGGFSARGGVRAKERMLAIEGAILI